MAVTASQDPRRQKGEADCRALRRATRSPFQPFCCQASLVLLRAGEDRLGSPCASAQSETELHLGDAGVRAQLRQRIRLDGAEAGSAVTGHNRGNRQKATRVTLALSRT